MRNMAELFKKLQDPKGFTVNAASYLMGWFKGTEVIPFKTQEEIDFTCSKGMKHLTLRKLKAVINLFTQTMCLQKELESVPEKTRAKLLMQDGFITWGLYQTIMADFKRHKREQKLLADLKAKKAPVEPIFVKHDPEADGKAVVPVPQATNNDSENRTNPNFWAFLFVTSIVVALLAAAWFVGMGDPPKSDYPLYIASSDKKSPRGPDMV